MHSVSKTPSSALSQASHLIRVAPARLQRSAAGVASRPRPAGSPTSRRPTQDGATVPRRPDVRRLRKRGAPHGCVPQPLSYARPPGPHAFPGQNRTPLLIGSPGSSGVDHPAEIAKDQQFAVWLLSLSLPFISCRRFSTCLSFSSFFRIKMTTPQSGSYASSLEEKAVAHESTEAGPTTRKHWFRGTFFQATVVGACAFLSPGIFNVGPTFPTRLTVPPP